MDSQGHQRDTKIQKHQGDVTSLDSIVLDKAIFANVFEKDIRRIYIYKKSERLAKAIQMILPAFKDSEVIQSRLAHIAVGLIDAGVLAPAQAREQLSRELLTLSSILSVARAGGMLSPMNTEIISREAHNLLQEVAGYDDAKVVFEDVPSIATLARLSHKSDTSANTTAPKVLEKNAEYKGHPNGHTYKEQRGSRSETVISILKTKGPATIKDISMLMREVSEKTIQRELLALVAKGRVKKTGERRWTTYTLISEMSS